MEQLPQRKTAVLIPRSALAALAGAALLLADYRYDGLLVSSLDPWARASLGPDGDIVHAAAAAVTQLGDPAVLAATCIIGAFSLAVLGRPRHSAWLVAASAGFVLFVAGLKAAVGRARPGDHAAELDAFPSGHAADSTFVWMLMLGLIAHAVAGRGRRPATFAALAIGMMVAWSRIALDFHWATDVMAGLLLGAGGAGWVLHVATRPTAGRVAAPPAASTGPE